MGTPTDSPTATILQNRLELSKACQCPNSSLFDSVVGVANIVVLLIVLVVAAVICLRQHKKKDPSTADQNNTSVNDSHNVVEGAAEKDSDSVTEPPSYEPND